MAWKRLATAGLVALSPVAAFADFHLVSITEVFTGTAADPNVQYIELQMYAGGQGNLSGHQLHFFDQAGNRIGNIFSIPTDIDQNAGGNEGNQAFILLATPEAEALFGVTADYSVAPGLLGAAGSVCFGEDSGFIKMVDCVAWGNYQGGLFIDNDADAEFGTPFNLGGGGISPSRAMQRRIDVFGNANALESQDDTDNSASDFFFPEVPNPTNNAGVTGVPAPSNCGDGIVDGIEECDDGNTVDGDGCETDCTVTPPPAVCGNAALEDGEECDDGNTAKGDGCDAACKVEENEGRCSVNPGQRSWSGLGLLGVMLAGLAWVRRRLRSGEKN